VKLFETFSRSYAARIAGVAIAALLAPLTMALPAEALFTGTVSGHVMLTGGAVATGGRVYAYSSDLEWMMGDSEVDNSGAYSIAGLPPGAAYLYFENFADGANEWFGGTADPNSATPVTVVAGGTVTANTVLTIAGTVSGHVTLNGGAIATGGTVRAYDSTNNWLGNGVVNGAGVYSFARLPAGAVYLHFRGFVGGADSWYGGAATFGSAAPVTVIARGTVQANMALAPGATVSGHVTLNDGAVATGGYVSAYDSGHNELGYAYVDSAGAYSIGSLPAVAVYLKFQRFNEANDIWYGGAATLSSATTVTVVAGGTFIADAVMQQLVPGGARGFLDGATRLAGASRYETAVQVSRRYLPGVPVVYVATGTHFPDALSAAAAAASAGGPLLLTRPTALPASVKAEIERLAPTRIFVIGGVGAVSPAVVADLQTIASVTRYGGADRYDTGLKVVNGTFSSASTAIVATGRSFPDALSATGVAGKLKAPVILVDGVRAAVTGATLSTLANLGVTDVVIAGGTGAVSSGIEAQLKAAGYNVTRYGGADRYSTAALINNKFFPEGSTDTMFLATGENFPDALAGGALAGPLGAPMYLSRTGCTPVSVHNSIVALSPSKTAVLGGTSVVSASAAANQVCR